MNRSGFRGHWPAMLTPMHEDGRLRLESVPALVEKFVRDGAGGIYLGGSTGQGPILSTDERKSLAAATIEAAVDRLPVMVHVGAIRMEDTLELTRHAAARGADAVSSVPPMYYPLSLRSTLDHYRRIAGETALPFYAYNFTIPNCPIEAYIEGLISIPTCRGLKYTSLNMYELSLFKVLSGGQLTILSGADESFLAAQAQGADGSIGSTQNVALPLFNAAAEAAAEGHWDTARGLMLTIVRLVRELTLGCGVAGLHAVLTREGIPCGQPRPPMIPVDEEGRTLAWAAYRRGMEDCPRPATPILTPSLTAARA